MIKEERAFSTGAMQNSATINSNNASATTPASASASVSTSATIHLRSAASSLNNRDESCGIIAGERERSNSILSSYLILSPSNPLRIFAISFLTHWLYPTVIVLTVCAFIVSLVYSTVQSSHKQKSQVGGGIEELDESTSSTLEVTRWLLFITILSEILIKSMARGFFVGSKFAYLRILWDWMDVASLVFIFLSIVIPWKTVEFIAAAVALLKIIPIHPGSINAFIFLCSCAKKLIPVLCYGLIIVWIYGFIIFAFFVKYHHPHQQDQLFVQEDEEQATKWSGSFAGVSKSNGSTSDMDIDENENMAQNHSLQTITAIVDVDGSYPFPSSTLPTEPEKSGNFSRGFKLECLPTTYRSLSGSFIQATEMLTLRYSPAYSPSQSASSPGTNTLNLNETGSGVDGGSWSCQYETFTLSIIETLVIISGTIPMIIMSFAVLANLFEKTQKLNDKSKENRDEEDEPSLYHPHYRHHNNDGRRHHGSRSISESHRLSSSSCGQVRTGARYPPCFNTIANSLCDCDYYFCCLANLQRRLNPVASGLLDSWKFKVFVVLLVSTDFLCMAMWLLSPSPKSTSDIDFPTTSLIIYYWIQITFILYTLEVGFRWLAVSSDQYWTSIWPAFDLTMVAIYWVGFIVLYLKSSYHAYYPSLCGILMIRMLKIVPYWKSLEASLKLIGVNVLSNRQNLFVIFLCSSSCILLKYAAFFLETRWNSQHFSEFTPPIYTFLESISLLLLYFPCCVIIVTSFWYACDNLRTPVGEIHTPDTTRNPSISLLLSESQQSHDAPFPFAGSRRSINESSSPICVLSVPNGISHNKFMFAHSPCGSNNGLLSNDTRSSIVSPSSDVLSPLLSIPVPNCLNGHVHYNHHQSSHTEDQYPEHEESSQLRIDNSPSIGVKRESFFYPRRLLSVEDIMNLNTAAVVILATVNISLNSVQSDRREMSWKTLYPGKSVWLEVFFILGVALHVVYKSRLSRFSRDRFMQIASVFDFILILAAAVDLFSSGMGGIPPEIGEKASIIQTFGECAKIVSACRGLLLLSRISWLQAVGSGLCSVIWKAIKYLTAFAYLWVIIIIECVEMQKIIQRKLQGQSETNVTFTESSNNMTEESLPVQGNKPVFEEEKVMRLHPILLTVTMLLFLLSIAVFLGFLRHQIGNLTQLTYQFLTKSQSTKQQHSDAIRYQLNFSGYSVKAAAEQGVPQPTKGICVPIIYFVTNHRTFDIIVMTVILLDGLGITLEHFGTSERALTLRKHYPAYMLFLYAFELGSKLYGNRLHFFKSYWNVFDCALVTVCIIDLCASLVSENWVPLLVQNVRFLRILRIFQFYPFIQRAQIIQQLFKSIPRVAYPLWNFTLFYLSLYLAVLIFKISCPRFIYEDKVQPYFPWLIVAVAPFEAINFRFVLDSLYSSHFTTFSIQRVFYSCGEFVFSLIKISVVFTLCVILVVILCQYLTEQDQLQVNSSSTVGASRSHSFHHDHDHGGGHDEADGHYECEDKSSYMIPCISPDNIDIETPTPTSSRLASHNQHHHPDNNNTGGPSTSTINSRDNVDGIDKPNSSLYKTTTITSSEEINGCKVFYVEAMITTV